MFFFTRNAATKMQTIKTEVNWNIFVR